MRWTLLLSLSAAVTLAAGKVSTNARCGNAYNALPGGMTCKGSKWGDCCSQYGYCGKTKDYCGTGCQSSFGTCNNAVASARTSTASSRSSTSTSTSTRTASSTAPSATPVKVKVTTNARCGNSYGASPAGMTCSGGKYGDCCSQYSYCGSGSAYCGTGCQAGFGKCDVGVSSARSSASSSSSSSSSSSASSSTPILLSTSSSESSTSTASSSSTSISISTSSSSPAAVATSTSETTTSASSSSSSSSDSSTSTSISTTSSESSDISVTPSTPTSTITSTPAPSPAAAELCGMEGYNVEDVQILNTSPFTTTEDCLARCLAEDTCASFITYKSTCYLAKVPFTAANVRPSVGTGLKFFNRDCKTGAPTTTETPTTLATSTTSSTPAPSPTAAELCGVEGIDNINLEVIRASPFTTTEDCLANCRAESDCGSIIIYSNICYPARIPITATNVTPQVGTGLTYYNRDCGVSAPVKPVKRSEEDKGSDKSVSIAKWTQGKQGRQRGPKDT